MEVAEKPKGIWFEKKRNRWRVKLVHEGVLLCCNYYRSYEEALIAWTSVKNSIVRPRPHIPIQEASLINQFLCRPLVGASRVQGQ